LGRRVRTMNILSFWNKKRHLEYPRYKIQFGNSLLSLLTSQVQKVLKLGSKL
jgi:hypothetical protein